MKKVLFFVFFACCLCAPAFSEEADSFWDTLRKKIEKITPVKKATVTTAVGGVRGSQAGDAGTLYWKGKDETVSASSEEIDLFAKGVELAISGDSVNAIVEFEGFLVKYPESSLREDTLQALANLQPARP